MDKDSLQVEIEKLINLPVIPESTWVKEFENASEPAIAGAIARWKMQGGGLVGNPGDGFSSKREAAAAILHYRLSNKTIATMESLEKSNTKLSYVMLALTVVGIALPIIQFL